MTGQQIYRIRIIGHSKFVKFERKKPQRCKNIKEICKILHEKILSHADIFRKNMKNESQRFLSRVCAKKGKIDRGKTHHISPFTFINKFMIFSVFIIRHVRFAFCIYASLPVNCTYVRVQFCLCALCNKRTQMEQNTIFSCFDSKFAIIDKKRKKTFFFLAKLTELLPPKTICSTFH